MNLSAPLDPFHTHAAVSVTKFPPRFELLDSVLLKLETRWPPVRQADRQTCWPFMLASLLTIVFIISPPVQYAAGRFSPTVDVSVHHFVSQFFLQSLPGQEVTQTSCFFLMNG